MSEDPPDEVDSALGELIEWSLVIQRRLTNSYSIFEGSDFDIEDAVRRNLQSLPEVDAQRLSDLAGLQPVVAKRHYHENGTMTWFEAAVVPASELNQYVSTYEPRNGAAGLFVLAVPTRGESPQTLEGLANTLIKRRSALGPSRGRSPRRVEHYLRSEGNSWQWRTCKRYRQRCKGTLWPDAKLSPERQCFETTSKPTLAEPSMRPYGT